MGLTRKANRASADRPDGALPAGPSIPCFRCGLCCTRYQPPLTGEEAESIAGALGMTLDVFMDRYVDDSWFEPGVFLLDSDSDACVFLEPASEGGVSSCRIHSLRPQACRDWAPGLHQKECLEALSQDWGLTASPAGKLLGSKEDLRKFRAFVQSLARAQ